MSTENPLINQSLGVSEDGFNDPTGEYPKKDYFFGTSVNAAARGAQINELYTGGGDFNVSIDLPDQKASVYPHNQVQETTSGHVIEIDDTPGGERILIKHKTGSGLELRADGSTIYSSKRTAVQIVGEDQTVIVEGNGKLIYKGNLDVHVTGDYNLTVGGNMTVNVDNKRTESVLGDQFSTVYGNNRERVHKSDSKTVIGNASETILGNERHILKGTQKSLIGGAVDFNTNGNIHITAPQYALSAQTANITAQTASIVGAKGVIGGTGMEHYGKVFTGPAAGTGTATTFYGTLQGTANAALFANVAGTTPFATYATTAGLAAVGTPVPASPALQVLPYTIIPPGIEPNPVMTTAHLYAGSFGIKSVNVDPGNKLRDLILKTDDYANVIDHEPTIHEIRAKLRQGNDTNAKFVGTLVSEKKLNSKYRDPLPVGLNLGRVVTNQPSSRFGYDAIGNNAIENKSKRFRPADRR